MTTDQPISRAPKPCHHKQATHQHGTHTCYVQDKCRCLPCAYAHSTYEQNRTRQNAYGRSNLTAAEPIREHIRGLMEAGIGLKQITRLTGVNGGALCKILYGIPSQGRPPAKRVHITTATKLLAITPTSSNLAGGTRIPAHGATRRIQALIARGWSQAKLADRLNIQPANFTTIVHGRDTHITARTAAKIRDLYDELWDQTPPAATRWERAAIARAQGQATTHGWAPPLAWDDDTIDDPDARPDTGQATKQTRYGQDTVDLDDLEHLAIHGAGREEAAARLGISWSSLHRACQRHDRRDLIHLIDRNDLAAGIEHPNGRHHTPSTTTPATRRTAA